MPVDPTTAPEKPAERFVPKWKFPEAQALGEAMLGNLTENMTNPEAIEAKKDARDLAMAADAPATGPAPAAASGPASPAK